MTAVRAGAALNLGGGQVLTGPAASLAVARALVLAERIGHRDGIRASPQFAALRQVFDTAAAEAGFEVETANFRGAGDLAVSPPVLLDPVDVGEVARLLRCSPQWARSLLRRGVFASAQRRPGGWVVERAEVAARVLCPG